jgi:hypothetical protein
MRWDMFPLCIETPGPASGVSDIRPVPSSPTKNEMSIGEGKTKDIYSIKGRGKVSTSIHPAGYRMSFKFK